MDIRTFYFYKNLKSIYEYIFKMFMNLCSINQYIFHFYFATILIL